MKRKALYTLALAATLAAAGCTDGFFDANRSGGSLTAEELARDNYGVGSFLIQLQNAAFPMQENTYQHNIDLIGSQCGRHMANAHNSFANSNFPLMNAPDNWVRAPFAGPRVEVQSAWLSLQRIVEPGTLPHSWGLVLRAATLLRLTDMYGPMVIGADADNPDAYTSQEQIYRLLMDDIDQALPGLMPVTTMEDYDNVYGGDFAKWARFANSLKLRMAIRARFADPQWARQKGEEAMAAGVIETNDQNASIAYSPNGLYKVSVDWGDSRACADLESFLNGYADPRRERFFSPVEDVMTRYSSRPIRGLRAGANVTDKASADSRHSAARVAQDERGVYMTAAEMEFCKAEAALLGWAGAGSAKEHYENGIRLSFEQWGAGGTATYIANTVNCPANYSDDGLGGGGNVTAQTDITIAWQEGDTDERKLERIITQKWIALFPEGQEAWNEIRRTGYPKVFPLARASSNGLQVPNRIPFPYDQPTINPENFQHALTLLGGPDDYTTRMWWQRPINN